MKFKNFLGVCGSATIMFWALGHYWSHGIVAGLGLALLIAFQRMDERGQ